MDRQRYARVKQIFREAMRWPPEERATVVATLSEDDATVRVEVLSLLAHHDDAPLIREPAPDNRQAEPAPATVKAAPPHGGQAETAPATETTSPPHDGQAETAPATVEAPLPRGDQAERTPTTVKTPTTGGGQAASPPDAFPPHDLPGAPDDVIEGQTLAEFLRAERASGAAAGWPLERVVRVLDPVAEALATAAERGIVHGAVRATYVVVSESNDETDGEVIAKLVGLGAAQVAGPRGERAASRIESIDAATSAPEQVLPALGPTGPWTDVYALALLCVDLMLGRPVAEGSASAALARARDEAVQPTPRAVGLEVPAAVETVMAMAMAMRPMERYQNVRRFWTALRESLAASRPSAPALPSPRSPPAPPAALRPARPRPRAWAVGAAILVILITVAAVAIARCS